MQIQCLETGPFATNCYLVFLEDRKHLYIIDPGGDAEVIVKAARTFSFEKAEILLTHYHIDHVMAVSGTAAALGIKYLRLRQPDHEYFLSPDNCLPPYFPNPPENPPEVRDYEENEDFKLLALPGHTEGGAGLLFGNALFCGDTLFYNSVGRTDLPGGSDDKLTASLLEVLMKLPDDVEVFCGHGPSTTIGRERRNNPYINGAAQ